MSFDWKKHKNQLLFVPLGGANEIGMNLNLYQYNGEWLIADMGIGFADDYLPGVDVILPNIDFLHEIKNHITGIVVTHAHEDHMGAIPYLWHEIKAPLYATPFCAAVLREKVSSLAIGNIPIKEVQTGQKYQLGPFNVELVGITHSIPEMQGLIIETPEGKVMHTGDWKFDPQPLVGPATDYNTLEKTGNNGVLAMVCDSTNIFVKGESGSEAGVREELARVISACKNRVAVTTFASNVARLESIIMAATDAGRKVSLVGRAVRRITAAAQSSGYLQDAPEFYDDHTAMALPRNKVLFICTGCQGEPLAASAKIANGDHPAVRFAPDDTFIFSSRVIPGNEKRISFIQNKMTLRGIEIINASNDDRIHVSGHPARDELQRMYQLIRPKIAIPVHGEARHLAEHAKFAKAMQVPHVTQPENGVVINLSGTGEIIGRVTAGYMAIDGSTIVPTDSIVIKTRRKLKLAGAVFVTLVVDKKGSIVVEPAISAPGELDEKQDEELLNMLSDEIEAEVERNRSAKKQGHDTLRNGIAACVKRVIKTNLDKKPVVEVHLAVV